MLRIRRFPGAVAGLFLALGVAAGFPAEAHDAHRQAPPPPASMDNAAQPTPRVPRRLDEAEQRRYFTDTVLLDQDGKERLFYTDMLKGKVVVVSFIYTNCTDICPPLMGTLGAVRDRVGDRMGKDVFFVTLSVDPENDTPEELKKYSGRFETGPGWTLLTGKKDDVDRIVRKFGEFREDFEDHSMMLVIGDVAKARWRKVRGDLPQDSIHLVIADLLDRR